MNGSLRLCAGVILVPPQNQVAGGVRRPHRLGKRYFVHVSLAAQHGIASKETGLLTPGTMSFREMPLGGRIYICAVCLFGVLACLTVRFLPSPVATLSLFEATVFVVLAAIAGGSKVCLFRRVENSKAVSMSLGFVLTFAGMLHFGASMAVALGVVSCCAGCTYPKRQPLHQLAFNVSLMAVEAFLGSWTYFSINRSGLDIQRFETLVAVACSTLVYYAVNTGGVSCVIGLLSRSSPIQVWRETFVWTAPSFFAGASVSAFAIVTFGNNLVTVVLFLAPVAYFSYQSYAVHSSRAEDKLRHLEEVQVKQTQLADLYLSTIKSLALAVDAKDQYTHQHILRVQRYAVAIAKHMGFEGDELEAVNTGALLHDIGKLGVPEHVLLKPGRLTEEEFAQIRKHPEIGAAILEPVEFPWPVIPVVKYHHEKWDGTGYPEGLKGEQIPLNARIMAVADVYDALTSSRSYRSAWTHERALNVICKDVGTHFDAVVVEAFKAVIDTVIAEMAECGEGPLAIKPKTDSGAPTNKVVAARDIARTSAEIWALYEIATTLSHGLGLDEILKLLCRKLGSIYEGSTCVFLLTSNVQTGLSARAAFGPNYAYFEGASCFKAESRSSQVVNNLESYLGAYDQEDLLLSNSESASWTPISSAMIVPLCVGSERLGTVNMYHSADTSFTPDDLERLELIVGQAAGVIHRAILSEATDFPEADVLGQLHRIDHIIEYMESRCQSKLAFSLLCVDMESFKSIADHFGAGVAAAVFGNVLTSLRALVDGAGLIGRYRNDDFLIVIDGSDSSNAARFADRLCLAIADIDPELHDPELGPIRLRASVGIANFPADGATATMLLASADRDLERQKIRRKLAFLRSERYAA